MIRKLKPKSEFSRNVLTLMTGTTIAQAIPIAISPILTRIYTPEDFGVFALYMSIASILSVVATGRYEMAIMLPKKNEDAINIVALSIMISFFVSFVSLVIIFVFNSQITNFLGSPEISNWLYFIPATVLLVGVYQSLTYWLNRKKEYKKLATNRVTQSITTSSINLGMGFSGFGVGGLIVSAVFGQVVGTVLLGYRAAGTGVQKVKIFKRLKLYALMKRYVDFPKVNLVHAFVDQGGDVFSKILIAKMFDNFILGQFYMVNRILLLPSSLIGSSLTQVLFRVFSEMYNAKEDFSPIVFKMIKKLFLIGLLPFVVIVFFGNKIFAFVFGANWAIAGEMAGAFALYILFHFIASTLSIIPMIVGKQKVAFYWSMVASILFLSSITIGYILFEILEETLWFLSGVMSIYFMAYIFWIYSISKKEIGV